MNSTVSSQSNSAVDGNTESNHYFQSDENEPNTQQLQKANDQSSIHSISTMDSSLRKKRSVKAAGATSMLDLTSNIKKEKELAKGLRKLRGKESMLIDGDLADPDSNMIGWMTSQVKNEFIFV